MVVDQNYLKVKKYFLLIIFFLLFTTKSFSENLKFKKIISLNDPWGSSFINKSELITTENYFSPLKTRYINNSDHLLRVDKEMKSFKKSKKLLSSISKSLIKNVKKSNLIIISDYNKGLINNSLIKEITKIAKKNRKIIIANNVTTPVITIFTV